MSASYSITDDSSRDPEALGYMLAVLERVVTPDISAPKAYVQDHLDHMVKLGYLIKKEGQ